MVRLFQSPHTIAFLLAAVVCLFYTGFVSLEVDKVVTTSHGLLAACAIMMLFALLHFRDGPFTRPHPAVWRLSLAAGLLYLMFLVFLLFQSPAQSRQLFSYWYPELGVPIKHVDFAEHCELTWENIAPLIDRFFLSHIIGWMTKALMLRDFWLCWTQAIQWEFLEIFFSFALPNFKECWWDQWIMDVVLCNGTGIYVGMLIVRWLQVPEMKWLSSRAKAPSKLRHVARSTFLGVIPKGHYSRFQWGWLATPKAFLMTMFMLLILNVTDLNSFLLKQVLWIPHDNPLNLYRLLLFATIALPAAQSYYNYCTDARCARLGAHGWIMIFVASTELMVWAKLAPSAQVYEGIQQDPWIGFAGKVVFLAGLSFFFIWFRRELFPWFFKAKAN